MSKKLIVKLLKEGATLPSKKRNTDEGFDLYSAEDTVVQAGGVCKVSTGIAAQVYSDDEHKYWLQIEGRSGMSLNGVSPVGGIVDYGYTGEIQVVLINCSEEPYIIKKEDRIAQLVIRRHYEAEVEEVEELIDDSCRGNTGFGNSGK